MASPSRTELETQLQNIINLLENERANNTIVADIDTIEQALEGDFNPQLTTAISGMRTRINQALDGRSMIDANLAAWAKHIVDIDVTGSDEIIDRLFRDFVDNSETVKSRAITFGTLTAGGGNVGTGSGIRLTKDADNYDIESATMEAKTAEVTEDQSTGTSRHAALWEFRGAASGDNVEELGSGEIEEIETATPAVSLLNNSSFDDRSGTNALPTDITDWTSDVAVIEDGTDYTFDESNVFLSAPDGNTTVRALNIKLSRVLTQKAADIGLEFEEDTPYHYSLAWNASVGTATGTLAIALGSQSVSTVVDGVSGWKRLSLPIDTNLWPRNFNEDDLDITITFTRTGGELLIDDAMLIPLTEFDSTWVAVLAGATPFKLRDSITYTDSATEAKIQRWFHRTYGRYLPASGTPSISDP